MMAAMASNGVVSSLLMPATAKLQADVGVFLELKAKLLDAQRRVQTADQAATIARLLANQASLEQQLPLAMAAAQRLAGGSFDFNDALLAGQFYSSMESQIQYAQTALGGLPPAPGGVQVGGLNVTVDWTKVIVFGGGAFAAVWALRRGVHVMWVAGGALGAWWLYRQMRPVGATP